MFGAITVVRNLNDADALRAGDRRRSVIEPEMEWAAEGHDHRSSSQPSARLCHALPQRPEKVRRRSISRLNVASKRSRP